MNRKIKAVCFGEVLFDNFPTHSKIGGAPLNVSSRLQSFGIDVSIISSIGNDSQGKKILNHLSIIGVNFDGIQKSKKYSTGQVNVVLNDKGIASYDISYPVAWDKIGLKDQNIVSVQASNIFFFGSLVCRDKVSRETLKELLKSASYKVFDVNLRVPHYTKELLIELMVEANFIKLNDDELYEIAKYLGCKYLSMEQIIVFMAKATSTKTICVTKGAFGAVLYTNKKFYYNSGFRVKVLDTVGSGDSFLASIIYKIFNDEGPQAAIDFGCAVGAMVAKKEGANPILTEQDIANFMNP